MIIALAPQHSNTWGRGGKKTEKNATRVVVELLGACLWAAGREEKRLRRAGPLRAISSFAGKSSRTTAPTLQQERRNIYLPSRSAEGKYRPAPSKKNKITVPSRREKNIHRPVPPREKMFTVPSSRGKKYLPSRPAEEKNNNRPVPPEKKIITAPSRRENLSR